MIIKTLMISRFLWYHSSYCCPLAVILDYPLFARNSRGYYWLLVRDQQDCQPWEGYPCTVKRLIVHWLWLIKEILWKRLDNFFEGNFFFYRSLIFPFQEVLEDLYFLISPHISQSVRSSFRPLKKIWNMRLLKSQNHFLCVFFPLIFLPFALITSQISRNYWPLKRSLRIISSRVVHEERKRERGGGGWRQSSALQLKHPHLLISLISTTSKSLPSQRCYVLQPKSCTNLQRWAKSFPRNHTSVGRNGRHETLNAGWPWGEAAQTTDHILRRRPPDPHAPTKTSGTQEIEP